MDDQYLAGDCPLPLQNRRLNIANHLRCIEMSGLGPANPKAIEQDFWDEKSQVWNVPEPLARFMLCKNCGHIWKTKFIADCLKQHPQPKPQDIDPTWVDTHDASGYCDKWEIPCTDSRTCEDWDPGGPVTEANAQDRLEDED